MLWAKKLHGGRMTKYKGRVASLSPVIGMAVSAIALGAGSAHAQSYDEVYSSDNSGDIVLDEESVLVWPSTTLGDSAGSDEYIFLFEVVDGDYGSDFDNLGFIFRETDGLDYGQSDFTSDAEGAAGLIFEGDVSGAITNTGGITVRVSDIGLTQGDQGGLAGVGINIGDRSDFDTNTVDAGSYELVGGTISNDGTINILVSAGGEAFGAGIVVEGDRSFSVTGTENNPVTITSSEAGVSAGAEIMNNGTISVSSTARDSAERSGNDIFSHDAYAFGIMLADWEIERGYDTFESVSFLSDEWFDFSAVELDGADIRNSSSGVIDLNALGYSDAVAYGIFVGDVGNSGAASVINDGLIMANVTAITDTASAVGIYAGDVGGGAGSSVVNSGSIVLTAIGSYDADGDGIIFGNLGALSRVENAGLISVNVTGIDGTAHADGIVGENISQTAEVANTGSILLYALSPDDDVFADGIDIDGAVAGVVRNGDAEGAASDFNGLIQITAIGGDDDSLEATGIDIGSVTETGSVSNYGLIELNIWADDTTDDLHAAGIRIDGELSGSVLNASTIDVNVDDRDRTEDTLDAVGVWVEADVTGTGTVYNTGMIDVAVVTYDADDETLGVGMRVNDVYGLVENLATIQIEVSAISQHSSVDAVGMMFDAILSDPGDGYDGVIRNVGLIDVFALGDNTADTLHANGIDGNYIEEGASLINSGMIVARAINEEIIDESATTDGHAHAIWVGALDGEFRNSGHIAAYTGDLTGGEEGAANADETIAIYLGSGSGTAYLETQGTLIGGLELGNDTLVVESQLGQNVLWQFTDIAGTVVLDDDEGAPLAYLTGVDDPIIMSAESDSNRALAFGQLMGGAGSAAMDMASGAVGPAGSVDVSRLAFVSTQDMASGDVGFWFNASGASSTYEDVLGGFDQTVFSSSASIGLLGQAQNGFIYGFTAGALGYNSTASDSASQEAHGGMLGATLSAALGSQATLTLGVFGGALQHEDERTIQHNWVYLPDEGTDGDGFETSSASYNSTFVTPSLQLSFNSAIGVSTTLVTSIGYSHSYISIEGYTENDVTNVFGDDMNATFGDQLLQIGEATLRLGIEHDLAEGGTLIGSLGFLQRSIIGDEVDVAVGDNDGVMSLASGTMHAAEIGLGYRHVSGGMAFDIGATAMASDSGSYGYGMYLGINVDF
jgi:hypothetical protein